MLCNPREKSSTGEMMLVNLRQQTIATLLTWLGLVNELRETLSSISTQVQKLPSILPITRQGPRAAIFGRDYTAKRLHGIDDRPRPISVVGPNHLRRQRS